MKQINKRDVFIFVGMVLIGTGLWFWFGFGPALSVPGAIIAALGIFGGD